MIVHGLALIGTIVMPSVLAQDLVDTRDLAGRAVAFEGSPGDFRGLYPLSAVGDVNGDGFADLGLSHTAEPDGVFLIFGGSDWTERNLLDSELEGSSFFWEAENTGGQYVGNVGDLNGDGYFEFAFGAQNFRPSGSNGEIFGVFFIIYGRSDFHRFGEFWEITNGIPGTMIFDSTPDVNITGRSGTVDINGDGALDLLVSGVKNFRVEPAAYVYVLLDWVFIPYSLVLKTSAPERRSSTAEPVGGRVLGSVVGGPT